MARTFALAVLIGHPRRWEPVRAIPVLTSETRNWRIR